jgi:Rrf2 family protein
MGPYRGQALMRVSVKSDYALRAMAQLASEAAEGPVKAERIAEAQQIPLKYLPSILAELKRAFLVTSHRGPEGGYSLQRPADDITLADVMRAVDGPLVKVHDTSLKDLAYDGPAEPLIQVWKAARASLRSVLETVTLADLASGSLPPSVLGLAAEYEAWEEQHPSFPSRLRT